MESKITDNDVNIDDEEFIWKSGAIYTEASEQMTGGILLNQK